ncbi:MAG TPA: hypothetical protein VGX92_03190 [Pyrinomonadaceae bacterium]|jgi:hypothetical protein|nr:hypothetical protein [Pyrinomonadaceae bacterium]
MMTEEVVGDRLFVETGRLGISDWRLIFQDRMFIVGRAATSLRESVWRDDEE